MNNLVSILIPCYNGEKFVNRCFDSIIRQDYPHMEVIAVNDGSTDQSEHSVLAWSDKFRDAGISLVCISQENKGPGGAINAGLKYITGEYLCLLDIDDELLESAVSTRVAFLKSHSDIDVVRSNGWYNRKSGKSLFVYDEKEKQISNVFSALVEGKTYNWAGSYMIRTSALFAFYQDREIYPSRFGQNLQLLMPLTYQKKCGYIDEPQMIYNIQENSLSQSTDAPELAMERILKNSAGYRDIRYHMIDQIINDSMEIQKYKELADLSYYRLVFNGAIGLKSKRIAKTIYADLRRAHACTINDTIDYCSLFFPYMVLPLRCIRKIQTTIETLRNSI